MFLDLKKIGLEGLSFEHAMQIPELEGGASERIGIGRCVLSGEISKAKHGFDLVGHLNALLRVDCSRCLVTFDVPLVQDFFLTLVADKSPEKGTSHGEDEEAALFPCAEGRADLVEMVSEQIYLNLPLKPVCREDCKGLCPVCGASRNVTDCDCRTEDLDPRLTPLLDLKERRHM
jgi:uncharacterized protein